MSLGLGLGLSHGGKAGGVTIVSDTFTRADSAVSLGTSDSGHAWTALVGTWGISSNQAYCPTPSGADDNNAVVNSGVADGIISLKLATGNFGASAARICYRATDNNNLFLAGAQDAASLQVYRRQAGGYTNIFNQPVAWVNGDILSVVLSGNSMTFKVNGVTIGSPVTDAFQATATKHGIGTNTVGGIMRLDNFSVTTP